MRLFRGSAPFLAEEVAVVEDEPEEIEFLGDHGLVAACDPFAHPGEAQRGDQLRQEVPAVFGEEVVFAQSADQRGGAGAVELRGFVHADAAQEVGQVVGGWLVAAELPVDDAIEAVLGPDDVAWMEVAVGECAGQARLLREELREFLADGLQVGDQLRELVAEDGHEHLDVVRQREGGFGGAGDGVFAGGAAHFQQEVRKEVAAPGVVEVGVAGERHAVHPASQLPVAAVVEESGLPVGGVEPREDSGDLVVGEEAQRLGLEFAGALLLEGQLLDDIEVAVGVLQDFAVQRAFRTAADAQVGAAALQLVAPVGDQMREFLDEFFVGHGTVPYLKV